MSIQHPSTDFCCRGCRAIRRPTAKEREFGRVICWSCGRTMDPIEADLIRESAADDLRRDRDIEDGLESIP